MHACTYSSSAMHDNSYPFTNWMDKTVFGCPTIQVAILHVHCIKNTKFNLISYIAKCTQARKPRAFCKGKHLSIKIACMGMLSCMVM